MEPAICGPIMMYFSNQPFSKWAVSSDQGVLAYVRHCNLKSLLI